MTGDVRKALVLPFENEVLEPPNPGERWALLNGVPLPHEGILGQAELLAEQRMRAPYLDLKNQGLQVSPSLEAAELDGTLVLAGRSRHFNEITIARAWAMTRTQGVVVIAGENKAGAKSLKKWASGHTAIEGSLSKYHAQVFWLRKELADWPIPESTLSVEDFHVSAGGFSANRTDKGSRLLANQFESRVGAGFSGRVADFGAGWGYLSAQLLKHAPDIEQIDLFEADFHSLQAAKANIKDARAEFHWKDIVREQLRDPHDHYDWVIMNPPFHEGRASEPSLGIGFIEAAARALSVGGRLLLVANTQLPYEQALDNRFRSFRKLAQQDGFKLLEAQR